MDVCITEFSEVCPLLDDHSAPCYAYRNISTDVGVYP